MHALEHELKLSPESGIIVFNVISGTLAKKGRLEVLLDDGYWPCFSTTKARSSNAQWEFVGEGFVKEIDFGQVWLRLNEADEGEKDDVVAQWKGDTKTFLKTTLVRIAINTVQQLELMTVTCRPAAKRSRFAMKMRKLQRSSLKLVMCLSL